MRDRYLDALLIELEKRGAARFTELKDVVGNPRTLSRKLKELDSLGMINSENSSYSLSAKGKQAAELSRKWRELLESGPPDDGVKNIDRIPHPTFSKVLSRYCRILLDHFGERLFGVLVFGSVARGDWSANSDIDLLTVVADWDKRSWERSRELTKTINKLRGTREYRWSVEEGYMPVIQHYPLDVEEARNSRRIYLDASVDGLILYEREEFLSQVLKDFRRRMAELGARRAYLPQGYYWIMEGVEVGEVFEL